MTTKKIYREPIGNPARLYRQDKFVISTFNAYAQDIRRGIELCKELEFNMIEFGWVNPEDSLACMTACEETGIDGIFQNWEAFGGFQETKGENQVDTEKLAEYLEHTKKYRHVVGYYVWDEPYEDEKIQAAAAQVELLERLDPERLPFTVAIPSYNPLWTWKNGKFEDYLTKYTETIQPAVLSLDYYPFFPSNPEPVDQLDSSELFLDIALLRELALKKGIPMWFYFQTQDDPCSYGYENFTPEKVRMQQYNALLYGAKGLQNYNVFNGAIYRDGRKGPLFYFTKDLNHRCHQLGKTLMALRSEAVFHSPEVLKGNEAFDRFRQPLSDSKVLADGELPFRCSVGEFADEENNRYLLILNRDYCEGRTFRLPLRQKSRVYKVSTEDGKQSVWDENIAEIYLHLEPGDAVLMRVQEVEEEPFLIDYILQK